MESPKRPRPHELTVVVGDESGLVKSLEPGEDEEIKVKSYGEQLPHTSVRAVAVDSQGNVVVGRKNGQIDRLTLSLERLESIEPPQELEMVTMSFFSDQPVKLYKNATISAGGSQFRLEGSTPNFISAADNKCGVASKGFPLQAYDLITQQPIWKAWILSIENIREKVNDTRCCFNDSHCLTATTAYNQVRTYDLRAGRKPVKNVQLNKPGSQYALALVSLHVSSHSQVLVGDTVGHVYKLSEDLRLMKKVKDKGNGAVRDLTSSDELLFTASLDRSLRVYDYDTLEILRKVQLWQKLNCLALLG